MRGPTLPLLDTLPSLPHSTWLLRLRNNQGDILTGSHYVRTSSVGIYWMTVAIMDCEVDFAKKRGELCVFDALCR